MFIASESCSLCLNNIRYFTPFLIQSPYPLHHSLFNLAVLSPMDLSVYYFISSVPYSLFCLSFHWSIFLLSSYVVHSLMSSLIYCSFFQLIFLPFHQIFFTSFSHFYTNSYTKTLKDLTDGLFCPPHLPCVDFTILGSYMLHSVEVASLTH
jgi:hypothetical protein